MLMLGSFCLGLGSEDLLLLGGLPSSVLSHAGARPAASAAAPADAISFSKAASSSATGGPKEEGCVRGVDAWEASLPSVAALRSSTDCRGVGIAKLRWLTDLHACVESW